MSSGMYAGYLNDPAQAKRVIHEGKAPNRRCRWCNTTLIRVHPKGAIVCGGWCDMPDATIKTEGLLPPEGTDADA